MVIIGLVILGLILLGGGSIALRIALKNAEWEPLPGVPTVAVKKVLAPEVKQFIRARMDRVVEAFALTIYPRQTVVLALTGLRVDLYKYETWEIGGVKMAGLSFLDEAVPRVQVGPSCDGLCHESGHIVENYMGLPIDYAHVGWKANGMLAAQTEYAR